MIPIKSICVCGAGTMGSGIAQVAAQSGIYTTIYDLNKDALEKARAGISKSLTSLVDKKKITEEEQNSISTRIRFTADPIDCIADLIIEAIIEKTEAKVALFNQLADFNNSETIFATNTSSLSVTSIAQKMRYPDRVIGLHFFNPAPVMKLVEIVTTNYTNDKIRNQAIEICKQLGKTGVICKDSPGFIVNHVARPYYLESLRLVESGYSDFAKIDSLLESSGFRMGPFKLMDLIGNDINYTVSCSVYEAMGNPKRLKPSSIQEQKVNEGALGRKTGKGYYSY